MSNRSWIEHLVKAGHVKIDVPMSFEVADHVPPAVLVMCRNRAVELEQEPREHYTPSEALLLLVDGEGERADLPDLVRAGFVFGWWPQQA